MQTAMGMCVQQRSAVAGTRAALSATRLASSTSFRSTQLALPSFATRVPVQRQAFKVSASRDDPGLSSGQIKDASPGFLKSGEGQRNVYAVLAAYFGFQAFGRAFFPKFIADKFLAATFATPLVSALRFEGATLLPVFAICWALKNAAEAGKLDTQGHQRLNSALQLGTLLYGLVAVQKAYSYGVLTGPARIILPVSVVATIFFTQIAFTNATGKGINIPKKIENLANDVKGWINIEDAAGGAYAAVTAGLLYWSFRLLFKSGLEPGTLLFAQQGAGVGLLATAVAAYSLKHGADKDKLDGSTYKNLNAGLGAFSFLSILFPVISPSLATSYWGAFKATFWHSTEGQLKFALLATTLVLSLFHLGKTEA